MSRPPSHRTIVIDGATYVPIWWVEAIHDRKHRTIRTWVARGMLASQTVNGTVYVHYDDAIRLALKREKRPPRRAKAV